MKISLHQYFSQLPDPRIHRNKKHLLIDIIILTIIAVLCGAESWDSIEMFGKSKKDFLSKFLKLPNGKPTVKYIFSGR
ncbi:MAG: transposase family protein [Bacteroidales bacterium]|nr:transposase family protein [Bacteroidales bacterium]